jgi:ribonucleoside-diphosphate reductase alpha chain
MLNQVQLLLQVMGIVSAVRRHNKEQAVEWPNGESVSKESWHLEITHYEDRCQFARLIGFPQAIQAVKLARITTIERVAKNSSRAYRSSLYVKAVTALEVEDEVFDFSVTTTHLGCANGVMVSNCSEYMHLDNSACSLASLNLIKFVDDVVIVDRC